MKLTTSVFSALIALALSAQAATVTVSNLPGNVPVPLLGTDGAALASGSVAIGIFSGDASALGAAGDIAGLKAAFTQFGSSVSVGFNGLSGLYQNTVTGTVAGTGFSGQNVFTVVGDGADIASSTGLFVFDNGISFVDEPGATPDAVINAGGAAILGTSGTGDVGGNAFAGFQLAGGAGNAVIPEPSSALLGLMGLGFLAFRRRK
ncbi:MAG: PEP-CTERM sorting domain-containing protein [Verrucomicrobiales bacterium]|jgi:hypothetical protein